MSAVPAPPYTGKVSGAITGTVDSASVKTALFGVGKAPVAAQANIVAPTDLATCITAITAILAALDAFGLTL